MATPAQVYSALTIENTYHILYPTAPKNYSSFADITNWAGLGYTTGAGDVVKGIFQCIDPVGQVIYENTGYASDSFSSQDWDLTDLTAPQFNLLTYSGTDTPIYGNYRFLWKVQITPNGLSAFQVDKEFLVELNNSLAPSMSVEDTYNCNAATFTSVDTTVYGAPAGYTITSLVRTHVTRPPLVSKKSDGTTAQPTVTSSSQTNLLAATDNPLWSGSYSSSIAAVITYKNGNNYTIVNCAAVEVDTDVVCDASLCILFCYLKKLYTQYFTYVAAGNSVLATNALAKWQKGSDIFLLIQKAQTCATNDVALLTAKFYEVTGFTEGCECDCTDGTPAPIIPTTSINGTDGTDGLTAEFRFSGTLFQWKYTTSVGWTTLFDFSTIATAFLQGSGAPSNGDGNNGDTYLDVDTGNIYLKTAGVWALTGNINGKSGAIVLENDISNSATTGTALEILKTYTLPANTLATDGSYLEVKAEFITTTANVNPSNKFVGIYFNGNAIVGALDYALLTFGGQFTKLILKAKISRFSNTQLKNELDSIAGQAIDPTGILFPNAYSLDFPANFGFFTMGGLNLTTTAYDITAKADGVANGDITCTNLTVTLNKFGANQTVAGIQYMVPFTTTAAVQSYANVLGSTGRTMLRIYLDGELLNSSDWSYDNTTDTLTFIIAITGASEVAGDYA